MQDIDQWPNATFLAVAIIILGRLIRLTPLKDWCIPWICVIAGSLGYPLIQSNWNWVTIIRGLIIGATSIGLYALTKQTLINRLEDANKPVSILIKSIMGT
jgi:hypothetical protein